MTGEELTAARARYAQALRTSGSIKEANPSGARYRLRNGELSGVYVDHGDLLTDPGGWTAFVDALSALIGELYPDRRGLVLCNVDSKSSLHLVGAICYRERLRQVLVLPDTTHRRERGTNRKVRTPSTLARDDRLLLVDDVYTPGDTTATDVYDRVAETLAMRRMTEPQHVDILVGLNRGSESVVSHNGRRLALHSVLGFNDLLGELDGAIKQERAA